MLECAICSTLFVPSRAGQRLCGAGACRVKSGRAILKEIAKVEWYTPPNIIEAARAVLGNIDLDPASSPSANAVIKAVKHYTIKNSGLKEINLWRGRVWMNPPYGKSAPAFCQRLQDEIGLGNVTAAVVLLSVNMMTADWFASLLVDGIVCVHRMRVQFVRGSQSKEVPHGSVIIGLGPGLDRMRFNNSFSPMGAILERLHTE